MGAFYFIKKENKEMALAGLSTLGVSLSYAVESSAGQKPNSFTTLTRINNIGGISLDSEKIDASALEDTKSRYIAGRADTGSTVSVTVNLTPDTIKEWEDLIDAYATGMESGLQMWFMVSSSGLGGKSFYFIAQPPKAGIPMPESGQNSLWTVEIPLVIVEYIGIQ